MDLGLISLGRVEKIEVDALYKATQDGRQNWRLRAETRTGFLHPDAVKWLSLLTGILQTIFLFDARLLFSRVPRGEIHTIFLGYFPFFIMILLLNINKPN